MTTHDHLTLHGENTHHIPVIHSNVHNDVIIVGGSWSTCMIGANKSPPQDVAHLQFKSRVAFKLVWSPPTFDTVMRNYCYHRIEEHLSPVFMSSQFNIV